MSPRVEPYSRHRVVGDVIAMVKETARNRTTLAVNSEPQRLLHDHPNCPVSLAQLQDKITRLALQDRVHIQLG